MACISFGGPVLASHSVRASWLRTDIAYVRAKQKERERLQHIHPVSLAYEGKSVFMSVTSTEGL